MATVYQPRPTVRGVIRERPDPDVDRDEIPDTPGVPRGREVRPALDTALALRSDRMSTVRDVLNGLTQQSLAADTEPVEGSLGHGRSATPSGSAC